MSTQISPQIRIVALAGLLLAVVGGGAMLLLGRSRPASSQPAPAARVTTETPVPAAPATKTPARAAATPATHRASSPATPARHATRPAVHAARGNLVDARLPVPLQWALSQHRIVVVSLYNPRSDVDKISVAEAHAGAAGAKVGFLLVSVLDNAVAGKMTALLPGGGLLPNPGVLVYRAPGRVVYRFDGFVDRATIEQAAASAADGQSDPSVADPTAVAAATSSGQ